jgi:hypothetical protein
VDEQSNGQCQLERAIAGSSGIAALKSAEPALEAWLRCRAAQQPRNRSGSSARFGSMLLLIAGVIRRSYFFTRLRHDGVYASARRTT